MLTWSLPAQNPHVRRWHHESSDRLERPEIVEMEIFRQTSRGAARKSDANDPNMVKVKQKQSNNQNLPWLLSSPRRRSLSRFQVRLHSWGKQRLADSMNDLLIKPICASGCWSVHLIIDSKASPQPNLSLSEYSLQGCDRMIVSVTSRTSTRLHLQCPRAAARLIINPLMINLSCVMLVANQNVCF